MEPERILSIGHIEQMTDVLIKFLVILSNIWNQLTLTYAKLNCLK